MICINRNGRDYEFHSFRHFPFLILSWILSQYLFHLIIFIFEIVILEYTLNLHSYQDSYSYWRTWNRWNCIKDEQCKTANINFVCNAATEKCDCKQGYVWNSNKCIPGKLLSEMWFHLLGKKLNKSCKFCQAGDDVTNSKPEKLWIRKLCASFF